MADSKISALTALTGANVASSSDVLPIVDTSVTTTKKILVSELAIALGVWSTGDVKLTLKTTADSGWVLMNDGTIGNAASGATTRANADTADLFTLLWNNTADADCAVSTGRGANAAADYAANKTIALPKALGRALAVYGSGSGLTARALAKALGHEELAAHTHTGPSHTHTATTDSGGSHTHTASGSSFVTTSATLGNGVQPGTEYNGTAATTSSDGAHTHTLTTAAGGTGNTGSTGAGNAGNMQPTVFLNVMIKL